MINLYSEDPKGYGLETEEIEEVPYPELSKLLDLWSKGKAKRTRLLAYSPKDKLWIAIDNSTNDCWTEEFHTRKGAINYLEGEDPENCE